MIGTILETKVAGIPCFVEVTHFFYQPPAMKSACYCSDPGELYGDFECSFTVLDRGYRPAPWLEAKMTDKDTERIEEEILDYYKRDGG